MTVNGCGFVLPVTAIDVLVTRTPKLDGEAGEVEPVFRYITTGDVE
jgi:Flp pilus assembly protein CpaB